MRCKAKSKQSGEQCKRAAAPGRDVCSMHGAKALAGIVSPKFKTGRYSKDLSAASGLLSRYQEERELGETTKLVDEISLLRARAGELLQNLEHGESGELWSELLEKFAEMRAAIRAKDPERGNNLMNEVEGLIARGAKPYEIWEEITSHLTLIGKLSRVELTRETRQQETMTAREAAVFKSVVETNLRNALQQNLEPELAARILADFVIGVRQDFARQNALLPGAKV